MFRFTLFGFPVEVHWQFWLTTALLGGVGSASSPAAIHRVLVWIAVVFASILVHELGHALAMRHFGDQRVRIALVGFGGFAQGSSWRSRMETIIISAAGPAAGLLVGLVAVALREILVQPPTLEDILTHRRDLLPYALNCWVYVNIFWSLVNLLPIVPLDGGHISLAIHGGDREQRAYRLSMGFAIAVAALGIYSGQLFLGLFFGMLAWNNWQRLNQKDEFRWLG